MVVYGQYKGNLKIILRQNNRGYFVLDVYNPGLSKVRFITSVDQSILIKHFLKKDSVEDWIDALLDSVVEGFYYKWFFLPFPKKLGKEVLNSMVQLTKTKYKKKNYLWR